MTDVMKSPIIPHVIRCYVQDETEVVAEANWIIVNIMQSINGENVSSLVDAGLIMAVAKKIETLEDEEAE